MCLVRALIRNVVVGMVISIESGVLQAQTLEEIVLALKNSSAAPQNLYMKVQWRDSSSGQPAGGSEDILYLDEFGRARQEIRPFQKVIDAPLGSTLPLSTTWCFDGEKNIQIHELPPQQRPGGAEDQSGELESPIVATIQPADYRDEHGAKVCWSNRNPLSVMSSNAIFVLESALRLHTSATITANEDQISVSLLHTEGTPPMTVRCIVTLSPKCGNACTSFEFSDPASGRRLQWKEAEYAVIDGFWYAARGQVIMYGPSHKDGAPPKMEWRFQVVDIKCNDPKFDDGVFQAVFAPHTHISDGRYGVDYDIGAETATDASLNELVQKAIVEKTAREAAEKEQLASQEAARWRLPRWALWTAPCLAAGLAVVMFWLRLRGT